MAQNKLLLSISGSAQSQEHKLRAKIHSHSSRNSTGFFCFFFNENAPFLKMKVYRYTVYRSTVYQR